ncbi:MAG: phenylacetate-CoA oxygenase subunit PaaI [Chloroflexi bacterium]|nr:phenylacetate-CoA oxygenase subunit PaaI [Chloroflexota bacterium]
MSVSRDASYVSRSVQWGALRGMRKLETEEQMTPEYRQTALKLVYALASTEFASVEQHQPWINQGPTAEDRFVQAQICADEAHQGMEDYRLLCQFGPEGEALARDLLQRRRGQHLLEAFNLPFDSWVDLCMFCCTMDLVAWYHLKALENSSFAPLARAMTAMVPEERFHASFGANRVRRLLEDPDYAAACGATRADVEAALRKWYPRALDTFGSSQSRFSAAAVEFGIRRWGNEELRQMYLADINPLLESMGLTPPPPDWDRHIL